MFPTQDKPSDSAYVIHVHVVYVILHVIIHVHALRNVGNIIYQSCSLCNACIYMTCSLRNDMYTHVVYVMHVHVYTCSSHSVQL